MGFISREIMGIMQCLNFRVGCGRIYKSLSKIQIEYEGGTYDSEK